MNNAIEKGIHQSKRVISGAKSLLMGHSPMEVQRLDRIASDPAWITEKDVERYRSKRVESIIFMYTPRIARQNVDIAILLEVAEKELKRLDSLPSEKMKAEVFADAQRRIKKNN